MNLQALITDHITEILIKIIEFSQARQKILTLNINNVDKAGFIPKDLAVKEFSRLLLHTIEQYCRNRHLVLYDTEHVKFGLDNILEVLPVADRPAMKLLEQNPDEYIEFQLNMLLETTLNQRIAAMLLKQRQDKSLQGCFLEGSC